MTTTARSDHLIPEILMRKVYANIVGSVPRMHRMTLMLLPLEKNVESRALRYMEEQGGGSKLDI